MSEPIEYKMEVNQFYALTDTLNNLNNTLRDKLDKINYDLGQIRYETERSNLSSMLVIYKLEEENRKLKAVFEKYEAILKLEEIK
jgi:hypothetical protein